MTIKLMSRRAVSARRYSYLTLLAWFKILLLLHRIASFYISEVENSDLSFFDNLLQAFNPHLIDIVHLFEFFDAVVGLKLSTCKFELTIAALYLYHLTFMLPVLNKLINISKWAIPTQRTLRLESACFTVFDVMILGIVILEGLATLFTAELQVS